MTLPPPVDSGLPTYDLSLPRDALDGLYQQLYDDGDDRDYEDGYVRKDGVIHDIRVRFRGSKPWHWLSTQKSMKLRLDKGNLIDGTRTFNLVNDPTPFGLEDQIILDSVPDLPGVTIDIHGPAAACEYNPCPIINVDPACSGWVFSHSRSSNFYRRIAPCCIRCVALKRLLA